MGAWVAAIVALIVLNVLANLIAQKVYPTLVGDGFGRRISYRFVFIASLLALLGICLLAVLILNAIGYRV